MHRTAQFKVKVSIYIIFSGGCQKSIKCKCNFKLEKQKLVPVVHRFIHLIQNLENIHFIRSTRTHKFCSSVLDYQI